MGAPPRRSTTGQSAQRRLTRPGARDEPTTWGNGSAWLRTTSYRLPHIDVRVTAEELVHLDVARGVATVTMDSPSNRNALSRALVAQLLESLRIADARADVRAVVLTHTGTTFCAGADLSEAVDEGMQRGTQRLLDLLRTVVALPTPLVAVVRGHVRAGGVGLVGACDLALVADTSTFAFTEAKLGLAPAIISLTTLSRLGQRDAARKYLTSCVFDGVEAARAGLVTLAAPPEALDGCLADVLAELQLVPAQGLAETKRLLNASVLQAMDARGAELVSLSAELFGSAVAREAMTAFRERRAPRWATPSPD